MQIIQSVPTNIITGFLGVGKTTAINHLLSAKPKNERWAVLVNEFGEIGVDASLLKGQHETGIFIKEVAGGCMCCTSGLPMQIALNQLLTQAKPQRLLIEPTGLGHPAEVIETLNQPHYKQVIQLQATITLVDARHLADKRYTSNDTFNEQLKVADIIVGNKTDLYQANDFETLQAYIKPLSSEHHFVENACLDWQWLQQPNLFIQKTMHKKSLPSLSPSNNQPLNQTDDVMPTFPDCGYIKVANQQDDYQSIGWQFLPTFCFDRQLVSDFLMNLNVVRAKAVFITTEGVFGYNKTPNGLTEVALEDAMDSRIEIISQETQSSQETQNQNHALLVAQWQNQLLQATVSH